jgi:hypothetical protein
MTLDELPNGMTKHPADSSAGCPELQNADLCCHLKDVLRIRSSENIQLDCQLAAIRRRDRRQLIIHQSINPSIHHPSRNLKRCSPISEIHIVSE